MVERQPPSARDVRTVTAWKSRALFLSSTFADMHAERDHLRTHVFSVLEERLRERCHYLEPVDLRQGVDTSAEEDEARRELRVLRVCLDEIERSRPFFVGLLGDRYGWVPPSERMQAAASAAGFNSSVADRSVTELEILYGVLENRDQHRRSWFYIRELDYTGMPPEVRASYDDRAAQDRAAPDRARRLEALKERLRRELPARVRTYHARWDCESGRVTGLDALAQMVQEDLWSDLDAETLSYLRDAPPTWQEADRRALDEYVESRLRLFVERPAATGPLLDHALSAAIGDRVWGVCVTAESGAGKSSVFGHLYRELRSEPDTLLLAHAAGIGPLSGNVDRMLRRWVSELAGYLGAPDPLERIDTEGAVQARRKGGPTSGTANEVEQEFAGLLGRAAQQVRVVVLVDALNQFEPTTEARFLIWLPKTWPPNARLLATATCGTESEAFTRRDGAEEVPLASVHEAEAREIANRYFRDRFHREPNPRAMDVLFGKQRAQGGAAYTNPLWLTLALQELNLLEADDYLRAEREFAVLPGAERVQALLCSLADELPASATGVYGRLLARAERDFGEAMVKAVMETIALSRAGWRESDLRALMPAITGLAWDELAFAGVRRTLAAHLVQRGPHAQWDACHATLREAVLERNLTGDEERRRLHAAIADHLLSLPIHDPLRTSEAMYHLIRVGDQAMASDYLSQMGLVGQLDSRAAEPGEAAARLVEWLLADGAGNSACVEWVAGLLAGKDGPSLRVGWVSSVLVFHVDEWLARARSAATEALRGELLERMRDRLIEMLERDDAVNVGGLAMIEQHICICQRRLADFYLRRSGTGDADRALAAYETSLVTARRLYQWNAGDAVAAGELSNALSSLGAFYLRRGGVGDSERAQTAYEESMQTRRRLYEKSPRSRHAARDLSLSLDELGDFYSRRGDAGRASAAFEEAFEIRDRLHALHPEDAGARRDLSVSLGKLGEFYSSRWASGDPDRAWEALTAWVRMAERLYERNPADAEAVRDLSVSREKLADFQLKRCEAGDAEQALALYEQSLRARRQLLEQSPTDADAARDVFVLLGKLGDFYLRRLGRQDRPRARVVYEESLMIARMLHEQSPADAQAALDLSAAQTRLGDYRLKHGPVGETERALAEYEQALQIRRRVFQQDPENGRAARYLAAALGKVAEFYRQRGGTGDAQRALEAEEESLSVHRRLYEAHPEDSGAAYDLTVSHQRVAQDLQLLMRYEDARAQFWQCHLLLTRMAEAGMAIDRKTQLFGWQLQLMFPKASP